MLTQKDKKRMMIKESFSLAYSLSQIRGVIGKDHEESDSFEICLQF